MSKDDFSIIYADGFLRTLQNQMQSFTLKESNSPKLQSASVNVFPGQVPRCLHSNTCPIKILLRLVTSKLRKPPRLIWF